VQAAIDNFPQAGSAHDEESGSTAGRLGLFRGAQRAPRGGSRLEPSEALQGPRDTVCAALSGDGVADPEGSALDLHEGISDPADREPSERSCDRWPERFRLQAADRLVKGRCKSANLCPYCARLQAVENAELLALDALNGVAPLVWAVLTTPSTAPEQREYYEARRQVFRALRRRWPDCEIAWVLEFTTGYGPLAGGARRPHWNALIKGIPTSAVGQVHEAIAKVWCPRQAAAEDAQFVGAIGEMGGLMRYLALHFQKESQSPPAGWSGHRFSATRGYLWRPTPEARDVARASLVFKRIVWKLRRDAPDLTPQELHERAEHLLEEHQATEWELVRLTKIPASWDPETGRPAAWVEEAFAVRSA
jgi:hypothetical protein